MKKAPKPPRWAQNFLSWYCKPGLLEDLEGDLNEYFDRNTKSKGVVRARLIYIVDVLKFLRPYTVRRPDFINILIHWLMIRSYVRTSVRSIMRNTLFSAINIAGLAISMSVGLLMIAFLSDLYSYDNFHVNHDRIFRVTTINEYLNHPRMKLASASITAGKRIRENVPGVENLTLMRRGFAGDAEVGTLHVPISGFWADESFFQVFSFELISGDRATALKDPHSIVLTENAATKLFGDTRVLGRSVRFDSTDYVVTGIMKDIPKMSHLRFESLVSFATVALEQPAWEGPFEAWDTFYSNYVYLTLSPDASMETVKVSLDKICREENANLEHRVVTLDLQPLERIAVGEDLSNQIGPALDRIVVWILLGLALIVIVSACFNYTNLSIARSLRRSREVGIRKVIGAVNSHVMGQFIVESVIIALLALVFSFLIFMFLRVQFVSLGEFIDELVSLELSPKLVLYFIGFATGVGMIAGFLPALFYSKIKASQVLKDASTLKVFRRVTMRKALIVLQYTFSLIFITSTLIGYRQYKNFLAFDLGFKTANIVNINLQGNKDDVLVRELSQLPEVENISRSRIITSVGNMYGTQARYTNPDDSSVVWLNFVDENYLPLHEHQIISGRNFHAKAPDADENEVIVNEELLKRFNIAGRDPQKALGEVLHLDGKELSILAVMKDFHYGTVESTIQPVAFRYSRYEPGGFLNVKVSSTDWPSTLATIESIWKRIDNIHPVQAQFYDDRIQQNYDQFSVMLKVIGFLAFLAICIASMGLFGMVVFNTERRIKEVSIRKVLGATEGTLVYLLSKGFLVLLFISAGVALPLTYLLFEKVVLTNFAYHESVGLLEMILAPVGVMVVAMVMIGTQTLKVARSNPAEVLKSE